MISPGLSAQRGPGGVPVPPSPRALPLCCRVRAGLSPSSTGPSHPGSQPCGLPRVVAGNWPGLRIHRSGAMARALARQSFMPHLPRETRTSGTPRLSTSPTIGPRSRVVESARSPRVSRLARAARDTHTGHPCAPRQCGVRSWRGRRRARRTSRSATWVTCPAGATSTRVRPVAEAPRHLLGLPGRHAGRPGRGRRTSPQVQSVIRQSSGGGGTTR